jgi:DNA repair protein RadC
MPDTLSPTLFSTPQSPYSTPKLKALPIREKPAYRVATGAETCNLAELLAVIIGGSEQIEIAERLLARFGTLHKLSVAHVNEIASVKGVGAQTALRLKASLALGRKLLEPEDERPLVNSPSSAAAIFVPRMAYRQQEYLLVITCDTRHRVLEITEVYHGSLNSAAVRIAEVFKPAIQQNGAAIVIAHNHPSGDPDPSPEDVAITRAIVQSGKLLDIAVLDHLIIGNPNWVSLKERGLGFS